MIKKQPIFVMKANTITGNANAKTALQPIEGNNAAQLIGTYQSRGLLPGSIPDSLIVIIGLTDRSVGIRIINFSYLPIESRYLFHCSMYAFWILSSPAVFAFSINCFWPPSTSSTVPASRGLRYCATTCSSAALSA
jgi:hypothetical protein